MRPLIVVALLVSIVSLPQQARSGGPKAPAGTERVFGHICEDPQLDKIARAHPLPTIESKRAKQRARAVCVLGDFGFRRAHMYLELEPGQRVWLYDAAAADRLGETAPIVTIEAIPPGRIRVGCAGCDPDAKRRAWRSRITCSSQSRRPRRPAESAISWLWGSSCLSTKPVPGGEPSGRVCGQVVRSRGSEGGPRRGGPGSDRW
jgi:hypothetical protein